MSEIQGEAGNSMSPQEEAKELRKEPLPPGKEDQHLLARIRTVDFLIDDHERVLAELHHERKQLLDRVIDLKITEQDGLELKYRYTTRRILDVEDFKRIYPEVAAQIIKAEKEKALARVINNIPLGAADALLGPEKVTSLCAVKVDGTPYVAERKVQNERT